MSRFVIVLQARRGKEEREMTSKTPCEPSRGQSKV